MGFIENPRSKKREKPRITPYIPYLSVETSDVGAGVVTDRHTDKTSTVTLLRMRAEGFGCSIYAHIELVMIESFQGDLL